MVFNDRTYSVLIVSSSEKFATTLSGLLPGAFYYPIKTVSNIASAKRMTLEKKFDIVLINSPLPDDFGSSFAIDISATKNTVCMVFVKSELEQEMSGKLNERGVYTIIKPNSPQNIMQAMNYLATTRERLRVLESKSLSLEEKMEEIKLVNRAKWLLIEHLKMTENDAHHYLEKQAMNRGCSRRDVAEVIINTYT
ncbi:MAG: ANTAR domain-containing protein [Lachnospiraceae bacterium]|nr:ANTAR domain-containing protein [Lachnospiraceae bacterium]MDY6222505.1 ANTAR domain-containing protein [Candidatus Alectryocaccobium sp.]